MESLADIYVNYINKPQLQKQTKTKTSIFFGGSTRALLDGSKNPFVIIIIIIIIYLFIYFISFRIYYAVDKGKQYTLLQNNCF